MYEQSAWWDFFLYKSPYLFSLVSQKLKINELRLEYKAAQKNKPEKPRKSGGAEAEEADAEECEVAEDEEEDEQEEAEWVLIIVLWLGY